jgi:hypothetical protein
VNAAVLFALGIAWLTTLDKEIGLILTAGGLAHVVIGLIRFRTRKASPDIAKPS